MVLQVNVEIFARQTNFMVSYYVSDVMKKGVKGDLVNCGSIQEPSMMGKDVAPVCATLRETSMDCGWKNGAMVKDELISRMVRKLFLLALLVEVIIVEKLLP
jgi:hypothetical protein